LTTGIKPVRFFKAAWMSNQAWLSWRAGAIGLVAAAL
jgi:hypothetical protein